MAPLFPSTRLCLAVVGFLGFIFVYALRVNLSVAMICMVNLTAVEEMTPPVEKEIGNVQPLSGHLPLDDDQCEANSALSGNASDSDTTLSERGTYVWDKKTQGLLLGAFFWGYLCTQILGGWLAERVGAKRVFAFTCTGAALVTLATPHAASVHYSVLWGLRFLLGVFQGVAFPSFHAMWSRWAPPLERSKLIGFTYAGNQVGNVLALPFSGVLCNYGPFGGWPSIFYILGVCELLWVGLWLYFVYDYPAQHPRMSDAEKKYILESLASQVDEDAQEKPATPWLQVLTSYPVWAIIVGHFAGDWGAYMMLTCLPMFMRDVLKFEITSLGFIASIPYIAYFMFINIGGILADWLQVKGILSTLNTRRAAMIVGFVVNYMDIAPAFAGTILGIGNTVGCLAGILAPQVMGWLVVGASPADDEWRRVFYVTAVVLLSGTLFFVLFAQGHVQPWASIQRPIELRPYPTGTGEQSDKMVAPADEDSEPSVNVRTPVQSQSTHENLQPHVEKNPLI